MGQKKKGKLRQSARKPSTGGLWEGPNAGNEALVVCGRGQNAGKRSTGGPWEAQMLGNEALAPHSSFQVCISYMWHVQDEFGADFFEQELKDKPMLSDTVTETPSSRMWPGGRFSDQYSFSEENVVVISCMPPMAFNPAFVAPGSNRLPVEPEISPFWNDPACQDLPPYGVVGGH